MKCGKWLTRHARALAYISHMHNLEADAGLKSSEGSIPLHVLGISDILALRPRGVFKSLTLAAKMTRCPWNHQRK